MSVIAVEFVDYTTSVPQALDAIGAADVLQNQQKIILKPNLVNDSPHPVTTSPKCTEAVLMYCRAHSNADIIIAEGCGGMSTRKAFKRLGYTKMAEKHNVPLVDLDKEPLQKLENPACKLLPQFPMPQCLLQGFLISIPVLKAHTLSDVTLSLKNMFGIAPAKYFSGGFYRKSKLHGRTSAELHQYVIEINQYRKSNLTLLDATIGLADSHLGGPECSPHVNKILAGFDPVNVDAHGAHLLGVDWRTVEHIRLAHGVLGKVG